jgi:hypothetical protein
VNRSDGENNENGVKNGGSSGIAFVQVGHLVYDLLVPKIELQNH